MAKVERNKLLNVLVEAEITTTSNKQKESMKSENPVKTAFLRCDEINSNMLKDLGLTEYTSKQGENFFAIKFVQRPLAYLSKQKNDYVELENYVKVDFNNFSTGGKVVKLNIIKGYSDEFNTTFFRIQSMFLKDGLETLEMIEAENPFA